MLTQQSEILNMSLANRPEEIRPLRKSVATQTEEEDGPKRIDINPKSKEGKEDQSTKRIIVENGENHKENLSRNDRARITLYITVETPTIQYAWQETKFSTSSEKIILACNRWNKNLTHLTDEQTEWVHKAIIREHDRKRNNSEEAKMLQDFLSKLKEVAELDEDWGASENSKKKNKNQNKTWACAIPETEEEKLQLLKQHPGYLPIYVLSEIFNLDPEETRALCCTMRFDPTKSRAMKNTQFGTRGAIKKIYGAKALTFLNKMLRFPFYSKLPDELKDNSLEDIDYIHLKGHRSLPVFEYGGHESFDYVYEIDTLIGNLYTPDDLEEQQDSRFKDSRFTRAINLDRRPKNRFRA